MGFGNNQGMAAGFGGNTFNGGGAAGGFQGGAQPGAFAGMGGSNMTPCQTDVWNLLKSDHIGDKGFTVDEVGGAGAGAVAGVMLCWPEAAADVRPCMWPWSAKAHMLHACCA
jgi:hypothetical protein